MEKVKKVTKLKIIPFVKFHTIIGLIIGLILGIIYSFGGLLIDTLVSFEFILSNQTPGLSYGTILAFGALIGMPIIFGTFGFLIGLFGAIIYNLFSKYFGEIKIEYKSK